MYFSSLEWRILIWDPLQCLEEVPTYIHRLVFLADKDCSCPLVYIRIHTAWAWPQIYSLVAKPSPHQLPWMASYRKLILTMIDCMYYMLKSDTWQVQRTVKGLSCAWSMTCLYYLVAECQAHNEIWVEFLIYDNQVICKGNEVVPLYHMYMKIYCALLHIAYMTNGLKGKQTTTANAAWNPNQLCIQ